MALVHEFGIIGDINSEKTDIAYDPKKYNCISVHDDFISDIVDDLKIVKTYWHNMQRPNLGLAYYGTTIIPPESLFVFQDILLSGKYTDFYSELLSIITEAAMDKKYMIHFGI